MKKLLYILLFVPLALFGQENYSLSFDGDDDYVKIFDNPIFSLYNITIAAWVRGTDKSETQTIFSNYDTNPSAEWYHMFIEEITGKVIFQIDNGEGSPPLITGITDVCDGEWHFIVGVRDVVSGQIIVFVDGWEEASMLNSDGIDILNPNEILIGKQYNFQRCFNGNIDNIQIWNTALSQTEIQSYMNCEPTGDEEGLVGYWNFNEGTGDTVYDISGNGNHGVINGATFSEDVPDNNCIEGCVDTLAVNYSDTATVDDGSCVSVEEYTIDSLQTELLSLNEEAITSLSSLQQALDTWNTTIDLSAGWNMIGYGCPTSIGVAEGLSNHTESILITKDNNGNVYMPEWDFNGIGDFTPGFGYQIKLTEAIEGFSLCDWYVNDIPEDNIVSLQEENASLAEENTFLQEDVDFMSPYFGCIDTIACNYTSSALVDDGSCEYPPLGYDCEGNITEYLIGMEAEGGIVFYVDETGEYGLVASEEDISDLYIEWGCNENNVDNIINGVGYGYQNSLLIESECNDSLIAASRCLNYVSSDYSDWFLPSKDELILMYNGIGQGATPANVGGFSDDWYWSSSENYDTTIYACNLAFHTGNQSCNGPKSAGSRVRAIRAFGYIQGCIDETACNFNSEANMTDGSCEYAQDGYDCDGNELPLYQVGDIAEGGIVFYVDESGNHGLVAALEDLGNFEWGCYGTDINGNNSSVSPELQVIGAGLQNTLEIVSGCSQTPIAASEALAYESEGYSDWYLPSRYELYEMYNTIGNGGPEGNIGGFGNNWYWSSSERESIFAWYVSFDDGDTFYYYKFNTYRVRVIRAF